jgi:hypothetical protein
MTESVGNETIEKYRCFLTRNWHWADFLTWDHIKNIFGYASYVNATYYKNEPLIRDNPLWFFDDKFKISQISLLPTDLVILDHTVPTVAINKFWSSTSLQN